MFLLVPAYLSSPGPKAVKRLYVTMRRNGRLLSPVALVCGVQHYTDTQDWCTTLYRHSRTDHAVPLEGDRGTVFQSSAAISQAAEWQMTTAIQSNT